MVMKMLFNATHHLFFTLSPGSIKGGEAPVFPVVGGQGGVRPRVQEGSDRLIAALARSPPQRCAVTKIWHVHC